MTSKRCNNNNSKLPTTASSSGSSASASKTGSTQQKPPSCPPTSSQNKTGERPCTENENTMDQDRALISFSIYRTVPIGFSFGTVLAF
jgi:hypothetical protein